MLWKSRFEKKLNDFALSFSTSIDIDINLYKEDIEQNRIYSFMLNSIGLLTDDEFESILNGLNQLEKKFRSFNPDDLMNYEDIHSAIENELKKLIGDTADKIHTGRSRNDQVATIFRMWVKKGCNELIKYIVALQKALIKIAKENIHTIIPGYTHLQRAQPISLAHHLMAYVEMLERDKNRLKFSYNEADLCPLGSGALAGSSLPLNRKLLAERLEFRDITSNSMDSVSDRDFVLDFLNACSIGMMHLSRLSGELILWSSSEWNFLKFSDEYSTGSSLMPQKKNPDIAELIRGKTSRIIGNQFSLLGVLKGLPLTYNRDLQEDKEPAIHSFNNYKNSLALMTEILLTSSFNKERFINELDGDYSFATDLVDWLVLKGVPFRKAHSIIGSLVKHAVKNNKALNELSIDELKNFSEHLNEEALKLTTVKHCLDRKVTYGSPNPKLVQKQIDRFENII